VLLELERVEVEAPDYVDALLEVDVPFKVVLPARCGVDAIREVEEDIREAIDELVSAGLIVRTRRPE